MAKRALRAQKRNNYDITLKGLVTSKASEFLNYLVGGKVKLS